MKALDIVFVTQNFYQENTVGRCSHFYFDTPIIGVIMVYPSSRPLDIEKFERSALSNNYTRFTAFHIYIRKKMAFSVHRFTF